MDKVIETKSQMIMRIAELSEANKRLQAENERLKEENNELKSSLVSQASTIFTLEKSSNDLSQGINKLYKALQDIKDIADRTDGNHPASVINMVSVIRHTINSVIGAEE